MALVYRIRSTTDKTWYRDSHPMWVEDPALSKTWNRPRDVASLITRVQTAYYNTKNFLEKNPEVVIGAFVEQGTISLDKWKGGQRKLADAVDPEADADERRILMTPDEASALAIIAMATHHGSVPISEFSELLEMMGPDATEIAYLMCGTHGALALPEYREVITKLRGWVGSLPSRKTR